ncbi:MAG: hypothetical protein IJR96_08015 [Pseudobutyrivibrio sp.]|nr:hypothetical protein [Pseudobutyrivibrio sp.]
MLKKFKGLPLKTKVISCVCAGALVSGTAAAVAAGTMFDEGAEQEDIIEALSPLSGGWPSSFDVEEYDEPEFVDSASRTNNAFNVEDFGEQGKNGWFYRYGDYNNPKKSKRLESFDGEKYFQVGVSGMEVKKNFIHTGEGESPILEWRAARDGKVNIKLTYVKDVNGDKNPNYPDGVCLNVFNGEELIFNKDITVSTTKEEVVEATLENIPVEKLGSLYFTVAAKNNNAYDGGALYVAINDVNYKGPKIDTDATRTNNNANSIDDFGTQGKNGWMYMCGNKPGAYRLVSSKGKDGFMDFTSPNLAINETFIHPAINSDAVLGWQPAVDGTIEVRMNYSKYEQNDGNPAWPDGTIVSVYKNNEKLFSKKVAAKRKGNNEISFRAKDLKVTTNDKLYFVADAGNNASYDGGGFDITILDRNNLKTETDVTIDESEIRQNFADVNADFGEQGSNGWIFQETYQDEVLGAYNMEAFDKEEDRYFDDSYLEIKRDYVNTGKGKSAVIKWKVAQTGTIKIDADYTKLKNEDKNPSWPDGTKVTIFHNDTPLTSQDFGADVNKEITKDLSVAAVDVKDGDYISMVVDGKKNNAYDGGKYHFSIKAISPLFGQTEKDVPRGYRNHNLNNASIAEDFGKQGYHGWYYQYGYYDDPMFAVNVEKYKDKEIYTTKDGLEIKRDYIMPASKGKSANVKWIAPKDGKINIESTYSKLLNEDKNPAWPDGVIVYLMKNNEILNKAEFEPLTDKVVTKDLSVSGIEVKAGDAITLLVDGKENTAYDGGKYTLVIEDAYRRTMDMVNNSEENEANLKTDFGEQGSNGWYYVEGKNINDVEFLSEKNKDGTGYISRRLDGLEVKADFVQPRLNADAMYKWVVAKDGEINLDGNYVKFGNEDGNPYWPDGTSIRVFHNDKCLYKEDVASIHGDGHDNKVDIKLNKIQVKKGDVFTFDVNCYKNNAWDGGRLEMSITDATEVKLPVGETERKNTTSLGGLNSIKQGTDGWWFMEGTTVADAKPLNKMNDDETAYLSTKTSGLEMKKDFVHPGDSKAAIYKWVVYEDGKIDILGGYTKFGQNDANPDWPDGVNLSIYKNDEVIQNSDVEAFRGDGNDNAILFAFEELEVKKGDVISFIISPKNNNAYDAGKLSVNIYAVNESAEDEEPRDNKTTLAKDFGEQGENGWYYGTCEWNGENFELLEYNPEEGRYYNNGKPELKADYVEPGNGKNAAYRWIVAKTGTVNVKGCYVKFANNADPDANGVCMRIFVNGEERKWLGGNTQGNFDHEEKLFFDENYAVHKGDSITFAIDPDGNDSYDGGRLEVEISPVLPEEKDPNKGTPDGEENEDKTPEDANSEPEKSEEAEESDEAEPEEDSEESDETVTSETEKADNEVSEKTEIQD